MLYIESDYNEKYTASSNCDIHLEGYIGTGWKTLGKQRRPSIQKYIACNIARRECGQKFCINNVGESIQEPRNNASAQKDDLCSNICLQLCFFPIYYSIPYFTWSYFTGKTQVAFDLHRVMMAFVDTTCTTNLSCLYNFFCIVIYIVDDFHGKLGHSNLLIQELLSPFLIYLISNL